MSFWRQLIRGIRVLGNRRTADQEIADEVSHYMEESESALIAEGLSPEEARRAARLELRCWDKYWRSPCSSVSKQS